MQNPKRVAIVATNYPDYERWCPNWCSMQIGLKRLGIDYKFFSSRPSINASDVVAYEPDFVIYGLMEILKHRDFCEKIRRCVKAPIVFWFGDLRSNATGYVHSGDYSGLIDAMFVSNNEQQQFWNRNLHIKQVYFLPLGCEPLDAPRTNKALEFSFVFIGGLNAKPAFVDRALFVEKLVKNDGLKLINSYDEKIRARIFKMMPEIYASAKVSLDVSHFTDIDGYTSNRYWNIPAKWGFALTKRFPMCEEFYPKDCRAYFDTYEECVQLKDYYLKHDTKRRKMIEMAHEVSKRHSYVERFKEMFSKL